MREAQDSAPASPAFQVETHGLDVIGDAERKGTPQALFWPGSAPPFA
ncbi:hypothetical protein AB5J49_46920 [Streptomyces sp. R28]|uniref:Uncharacterized protein n=1 Tax=Streptomyces sp. R28 TaxID=3238628 RepID=A0AB39QFD4_9ACTN